MFRLVASKRFQKNLEAFLLKHPDIENILEDRINILQKDPWSAILKTHKLSGKLKNCLACHITYEYRLVFIIDKDKVIRYIEIIPEITNHPDYDKAIKEVNKLLN